MSGQRRANWQRVRERRMRQDVEEGRVHTDVTRLRQEPEDVCPYCLGPLNPDSRNANGTGSCPCLQNFRRRVHAAQGGQPWPAGAPLSRVSWYRNGPNQYNGWNSLSHYNSVQSRHSVTGSQSNSVLNRETLDFSFENNANQRAPADRERQISSSSSSSGGSSGSNGTDQRITMDSSSDDSDDLSSDDDESEEEREAPNVPSGNVDNRERLQPNSVNTRYQDSTPSPDVPKSTVKEIPGFYYDEEQKQYFRITNTPYNSGSSFYTPEKIKRMDFEKKRHEDCQAFNLRPTVNPSCSQVAIGRRNILGLVQDLQTRGISSENLSLFTTRYKATNLKLSTVTKAKISQHHDTIGHLEEILPASNSNKVLCLWETEDRENHYAQLMAVCRGPVSGTKRTPITLRPWGHAVYPLFDKITCIRMAPGGSDRQNQVIYTASDPENQAQSTINFRNLDKSVETGGTQAKLKHTVAYTCAWNRHTHSVSVGTQKKALVMNMVTNSTDFYKTNKSDPLAQTFHPTDIYLLFSGTRKGEILRHDTRSGDKPVTEWKHGLRIGHLHCLEFDSFSLMVSDISGKICMYDTRRDGIVRTFNGLANTHKLLPFQVDDTETILSSTGTDCYTCLWDLKSTELLSKVPPPLKVTPGYMPRSVFSTQWAGGSAGSGLIMGMKDRLLVYRTTT